MSGEHKRKRDADCWRPEETKRFRSDKRGNQHADRGHSIHDKEGTRKDDNDYRQKSIPSSKAPKEILPSANELKTQIRDIQRLLKRSDRLPPGVKIEKERALEGYKRDLAKVEERKSRSNMIKRYHFIRFLERKSAERKLSKLEKRQREIQNNDSMDDTGEKELADLEAEIRDTRIDLNYAMYYPLTEKYISLYPNTRDGPEPEESNVLRNNSGEKPPMWYVVEKCMKEGTLELLRNGKLNIGISGERKDNSKNNVTRLPEHSKGKGARDDLLKSEKTGAVGERRNKSSANTAKDSRDNNKGKKNDDDARMDSGDESEGGFFDE